MYESRRIPPSALFRYGLLPLSGVIDAQVHGPEGTALGLSTKVKSELIGTSDYPSNKIFTIPNVITFIRLILTGVFLYLFVSGTNRSVALAVYAIAAATDWLDGYLARMTKSVSWLGKTLDPIVDRALLFTGVLGLVLTDELPFWTCAIVIGRDIYLAIGACIVHHFHKRPIDVVYTGKIATALLMSGFTLMLLGVPVINGFPLLPPSAEAFPGLNGSPAPLGIFFVYLGLVFSLITAVIYTVKGIQAVYRAVKHPDQEDDDYRHPKIIDSDGAGTSDASSDATGVE